MFTIIERSNSQVPIKDKETDELKGFIKIGTNFTLDNGTKVSYNSRSDTIRITRPGSPVRYRSLSKVTDNRGKVLTNPPQISIIKRKDLNKKLGQAFAEFILQNI